MANAEHEPGAWAWRHSPSGFKGQIPWSGGQRGKAPWSWKRISFSARKWGPKFGPLWGINVCLESDSDLGATIWMTTGKCHRGQQ